MPCASAHTSHSTACGVPLMQIDELRMCLEDLQLWDQRPKVGPDPEGEALGKLAGKLEQVVINCCEVAKMEGIQMDELLGRTYEV